MFRISFYIDSHVKLNWKFTLGVRQLMSRCLLTKFYITPQRYTQPAEKYFKEGHGFTFGETCRIFFNLFKPFWNILISFYNGVIFSKFLLDHQVTTGFLFLKKSNIIFQTGLFSPKVMLIEYLKVGACIWWTY